MGRKKVKGNSINGWLVLDKPAGLSSAQAVSQIKHCLKPEKIGHAGTLDPLASGLLPLAFGEATKTVSFMMNSSKTYRFSLAWGCSTETDDLEGAVVKTSSHRPSEADVHQILPLFTGNIMQLPPVYSALKIAGKRAYSLARAGKAVNLAERPAICHNLKPLSITKEGAQFDLTCGKGFYVRALARDLGEALGTCAHVTSLRRTHIGPFGPDEAISLAFFKTLVDKSQETLPLLPIDVVLDDIPVLTLSCKEAKLLRQGCFLPTPSLQTNNLDKEHGAILPETGNIPHENGSNNLNLGLAKCGETLIGLVEFDNRICKARRMFNLDLKTENARTQN